MFSYFRLTKWKEAIEKRSWVLHVILSETNIMMEGKLSGLPLKQAQMLSVPMISVYWMLPNGQRKIGK